MAPSAPATEYCSMPFSTPSPSPVDSEARPVCIGLTGGIGTGKSTVARILRTLGHPVYDADAAAKQLYDRSPELLAAVVKRFGSAMLGSDGRLDRMALGARVFSDSRALAELNALVHPAIRLDFRRWAKARELEGYAMVFREAAILFESGSHRDCDQVWSVSAPLGLRVSRVMRRNGWAEEQVRERMAKQWPSDRVDAAADRVIVNDGLRPLVPQILTAKLELKGERQP